MKKWLRRIALGLGVATLTLVCAGFALKLYGEHQLEEMTARFVEEVGPIPEVEFTPEGRVNYAATPNQDVMARMREGRAAGDAALAAVQLGDRARALELLAEVAAERDTCFSQTDLVGQMIGVALGQKVLEVSRALVDDGPLSAEETQTLSAVLEVDSMEAWKRTLAHEASLYRTWTDEVEEAGGALAFVVRLQESHTIAASLGVLLGMHEAVRDRVPDVEAHIRASYEEASTASWLNPVAAILIPNLIDLTEKRRDYRADLEAMRSRVASVGGVVDSV